MAPAKGQFQGLKGDNMEEKEERGRSKELFLDHKKWHINKGAMIVYCDVSISVQNLTKRISFSILPFSCVALRATTIFYLKNWQSTKAKLLLSSLSQESIPFSVSSSHSSCHFIDSMCVCEPEKDKMEEEKYVPSNSFQYCTARIMSSEIVEMVEDSVTNSIVEIEEDSSKCLTSSRSGVVANDVYVAVGKDDLDVLKWVLDHAVSSGARVFLVHVFPPITYIRTPVGRLSKSQLSQEQLRYYVNEENNKRRNLLQKYIRLCTDAKVTVDTMLLESNVTSKAILDLIPVLNITNLVMGTKRPPRSRLLLKRVPKGEFVKKNAPDYCKVTIVYGGKNVMDEQQQETKQPVDPSLSVHHRGRSEIPRRHSSSSSSERKFFECVCFSGKFD